MNTLNFYLETTYLLEPAVSMGAGNNRPQGSLLPQYRPSMLTKNPSNV